MYIDILWVHYNWREKRGSPDTLRGIVEMRENNTCERREGERERKRGGREREGREREREKGKAREGGRGEGKEKERLVCTSIKWGKHIRWVHGIKGHSGHECTLYHDIVHV